MDPAPGGARLVLVGTINEHFSVASILPKIHATAQLIIDTGDIKRINSAGVRSWIGFLDGLPNSVEVTYERLPVVMVEQANMVLNFLGHGQVKSFLAPYFCYECQESQHHLIETTSGLFDRNDPKPPPLQCKKCGGGLDFDDDESGFFAFLESLA